MKRRWKFLADLKPGDKVKLSTGEPAEIVETPDSTRTSIIKVRVSIDKIKEIETTCDHYFASYIVDGNACYEPCEFCGEVKHAGA